jgi:hypothetical protein
MQPMSGDGLHQALSAGFARQAEVHAFGREVLAERGLQGVAQRLSEAYSAIVAAQIDGAPGRNYLAQIDIDAIEDAFTMVRMASAARGEIVVVPPRC